MGNFLVWVAEKIEPYWFSLKGLFLSILLGLITSYILTGFGHLAKIETYVLPLLFSLFISTIWLYTNQCPKTPKGRVGIALALLCEDRDQYKRIYADLNEALKAHLSSDDEASHFHVTILPSYISRKLTEPGMPVHYLNKSKSRFLLFCRGRQREIQGKLTHVLNFESLVSHAIVSTSLKKALQDDMRRIIPKRALVPIDGDVFAFEVASTWLDTATRYIIAVAAMISGYVAYAELQFLRVEEQIRSKTPEPLAILARRVPQRLIYLYGYWLGDISENYRINRNKALLKISDMISSKLLKRAPEHYQALLSKAICDFVLRRDTRSAIDSLLHARRNMDVTWRYGLAFLYAYVGDEKNSLLNYKRAFKGVLKNITVPIQSEEFINIVLSEEPGKVQLRFCTGLINFAAKEDREAAKVELTEFLESENSSSFPVFKKEAQEILNELDK